MPPFPQGHPVAFDCAWRLRASSPGATISALVPLNAHLGSQRGIGNKKTLQNRWGHAPLPTGPPPRPHRAGCSTSP